MRNERVTASIRKQGDAWVFDYEHEGKRLLQKFDSAAAAMDFALGLKPSRPNAQAASSPSPQQSAKAGWRPSQWAAATGLSRSYVYELLAANRIHSVRIGSARIITTQPNAFLAGLADK